MALFYPCMKIKNFLGQMPLFEVLRNMSLAPSMCLLMWIKVDKQDFLTIGSRDFKNSFHFGIVQFPSKPGMRQKLRLVKRPFRTRSKQCVFPHVASRLIPLVSLKNCPRKQLKIFSTEFLKTENRFECQNCQAGSTSLSKMLLEPT